MKFDLPKLFVSLLFICVFAVQPAYADEDDEFYDPTTETNHLFKDCKFEFNDMPHVQRLNRTFQSDGNFQGNGIYTSCFLTLTITNVKPMAYGDITLGSVALTISRKKYSEIDNAFPKEKSGKRKFAGHNQYLSSVRINQRSTQELVEKDGVTLVGREKITGNNLQNGALLTLTEALILRETPDFFVHVDITFAPNVPANTSGDVISDLVRVVQSIKKKTE